MGDIWKIQSAKPSSSTFVPAVARTRLCLEWSWTPASLITLFIYLLTQNNSQLVNA